MAAPRVSFSDKDLENGEGGPERYEAHPDAAVRAAHVAGVIHANHSVTTQIAKVVASARQPRRPWYVDVRGRPSRLRILTCAI